MTIKQGFNDKPTHIRFDGEIHDRKVGLWIEQRGLEAEEGTPYQRYETLSYITLDELLDLQDEIKEVIKEMVS